MKTYPIDSTFTVKDLMQDLSEEAKEAFEVAGIPFQADR